MAVVGIIALAVLVQFAIHTVRTDPRDSRAIALRELQVNTLEPGERVLRMVSVFKRPAISYFRATRGVLALTNKRLLYIGVEPRDLLAAPDVRGAGLRARYDGARHVGTHLLRIGACRRHHPAQ
jgi:hypothetical protein